MSISKGILKARRVLNVPAALCQTILNISCCHDWPNSELHPQCHQIIIYDF